MKNNTELIAGFGLIYKYKQYNERGMVGVVSLQAEPVHGGADPVVLGQVLDGADGSHGGAPVVDVPGAHVLDVLGCHSLQTQKQLKGMVNVSSYLECINCL